MTPHGKIGITNRVVVAAFVFLIGLPPVIAAFQVIANQRRKLVFIGSLLLPIPVLIVLLFGSAFLFESSNVGTRLGSFLGIWLSVLITDVLAGALFIHFAPRHLHPEVEIHP